LRKHLKRTLSETISPQDLTHVYNSYDIIGDIAIVRLSERAKKYGREIAKAIMSIHTNVKTVLAQTGSVQGEFRLRRLEHVAGEKKTVTAHSESGCLFRVDVERCYFSPRLFYERMRIARQVTKQEVVINMFAGVGCFSVLIANHSSAKKVYSIDINRPAVRYMEQNIRANKVYGKVIPILGDAKDVVEKRLSHVADRVLMPLPEKAFEYLPHAILALKKMGGWIHYYDFEHAQKDGDAIEKITQKVSKKLESLDVDFEIAFGRVVRTAGPNWYQVVLDILIKNSRRREHCGNASMAKKRFTWGRISYVERTEGT
jgi:tRNA (guanine37-N1)-methyltransferase